MMNALHLLWIIPVAGSFGAFVMALFAGSKRTAEKPAAEKYERIYFEDDHKYSGLLDDE